MAEQDDLYYLQPGFDLSSLTIPRIRSILVAHNVTYPSSAKKQDLIDIMQQELLPKAKKLLGAQARVRRTSKGITDVPSSQDSTVDYDDDDEHGQMLPPPPPKTPRGRKSRTDLVGDAETKAPTPRTARKSKTPSGRRGTKAAISDTETEPEKPTNSVKRTRKSMPGPITTPQPAVTLQEPSTTYSRRSLPAGESPFSDDNPFQSGSSPPPGAKRISSSSRTRKSLGTAENKSTGRRTTRSPSTRQVEVQRTQSRYELPVGPMGIDRNGVEVSEEFTADAEQELEQELASDKQLARARSSALTRHRKKPASTAAKTAPFAILSVVLAGIGGWYRQEKINVGYCGVGQSDWSLSSNPNIPVWVHENLQPQCEPCPPHAICFTNMDVQCENDFVLQPHPLSFNGLVPLPPTCEPDSEKEKRIKAVADRAVEDLRERRALYECGDTLKTTEETSTSTVLSTVDAKLEIAEETLKQEISKSRRKGMSENEFQDLWHGALDDIVARDEIEVLRDGSGHLLLSSKSLARLPFTCAVRKSFTRSLSRNRIPIAALILAIASLAYGRQVFVNYNQAKAQTPSLVAMTLDRLATQAALKEDGRTSEGFISIAQLRDDVLRNVFSARERERAWQRVRKVVEQNSNVRAATREGGKTGEWSRVWEWIGPVDLAPGLEGRRSGGMIKESSIPGEDGDRSLVESRRWNEGRPIY